MPPLQLICILLLLIIWPIVSATIVSSAGCPGQCGDLSIPYPFGVGLDCSRSPYFNVNCNTSTNPPKAYLSIINEQVIEIRLNQSYIRVKYPHPISARCDFRGTGTNVTGRELLYNYSKSLNLSGTPYTLWYGNTLTAIGCDDMVLQSNGTSYVRLGGCSSFCINKNDTGGVGYCSFNGCCQAYIPGGTSFVGAELIDLSGRLGRTKLFPCSYAFIQEQRKRNETLFSYPLHYLDNPTTLLNDNWESAMKPPVVLLKWKLGAENCSRAKLNSTTYACRDDKSICVDDANDVGASYTCSCVQGYDGNPYLDGGCQQTISFSSSIAKDGCLDQCGKIWIPFPFGVGLNCSLAPSFEIVCDSSTNPPTPYLRLLNAQVIELNSSKALVNYRNVASTCYSLADGISKPEKRSLIIDLLGSQYSVSHENWITAIGCDDMVVAVIGEDKPSSIRSSCAVICSDDPPRFNNFASCSYGYGIISSTDDGWLYGTHSQSKQLACIHNFSGTTYLEVNLSDLNGRWPRTVNVSCSYAFISYIKDYKLNDDGMSYGTSFPFLNNSTYDDDASEMNFAGSKLLALDWRIGAVNCKEAQLDLDNFACKANTDCVDVDATVGNGGGGYLCNCSKGYRGNPYLNPGCQDINECADNATNTCNSNSICNNNAGSYHCSCPKGYYAYVTQDGTSCIPLPPSKSKMIILTGIGSGLGLVMLLLMCFWLYKLLQKRKLKMVKDKFFKRNGGLLLQQQTNEGVLGRTKVFPSKELEVATDQFNESRILGHGGQGTVYKGMLSNGTIVAIKKSKLVEEDQVQQFINEVAILSQINHRNVVKLLGCCLETEVPLLIYEFMPNGTLFELIHDPSNEFPLLWNMRLKIAADIAGALAYLHSASSMPIYHRDIKSSNILLDEKYVVKVSDFGTSRSIAADQTHLTTLVKGTFGYLDPEYFQSSQFTEKSDVYSFGVVLVELLTRQRPISFDKTEEERGLATRFVTCMERNCLDTILDHQVWEQGKKEEVILVARLAQRCLNLKGKMRPTMKEVATELESFRISQSAVKDDEVEEVRDFEAMPTTFPEIDYSWTSTSHKSFSASSPDSHPLMFATM